jgi:pSer/pThr/pTyr-binding forkhead associated (FHA) protein
VRRALPLLAAAALGCSNITDSGNGVVALEVKVPSRLELEVGDTIQLSARALDRNGDSAEDASSTSGCCGAVTGR